MIIAGSLHENKEEAMEEKMIAFPATTEAFIAYQEAGTGRNLTEEQKSYLRGKQYEAEKLSIGRPKQSSSKNYDKMSEFPRNKREIKDGTAGVIGRQYGVNARTIHRDADFV